MFGLTYRKIGGIHWLRFGRWRVSVCRVTPKAPKMPKAAQLEVKA